VALETLGGARTLRAGPRHMPRGVRDWALGGSGMLCVSARVDGTAGEAEMSSRLLTSILLGRRRTLTA
jgi:hypothetical protein